MNIPVRIKAIGTFHPSDIVTNEDIIRYFKEKQKIDITDFLEGKGRDVRHVSKDIEEDIISMGVKASRQALRKAGLTGRQIDLIVFVTDTPMYLAPCNAIYIHKALKCRNDISVYDANSNCVGMVSQMDNVARMMQMNDDIDKVLIVGSQELFHYTEEPMLKSLFGDSACAIVLEKTKDEQSYIIDSVSYTDSSISNKVILSTNDMNLKFEDLSGNHTFYHATEDIKNLLAKTNTDKNEVKKYFVSQYDLSIIQRISSELNEPMDKFVYIGDLFGYTGCTSPFLALYKAIECGEIERGDLILIWSTGGGITSKAILMRY